MERTPMKLALGAAAALSLGACATPPPVAEMSTARTMVSQVQPEAARYAPAQLRQAQAKLQMAEDAFARGENERAKRLAEQAAIDARLAQSIAESARLELAVNEVQQSIRALQEQIGGKSQ